MGAGVFLAVIGAALLHAVWNALVKGGLDKRVGMAAVVLGGVLPSVVALPLVPVPRLESLPYMATAVALHVGYQLFLMRAYMKGDLTQVYPIARGTAPLLVALVSVFVLGVQMDRIEVLAILIIVAGILSLALVRRADGLRNGSAAGLAVVTGVFIASYSLVDGLGARVAQSSVGYYSCVAIVNAAVTTALLVWRAPGVVTAAFGAGRRVMVIGGGASWVAYAIVTWAFTQAPIAIVTALRETSIVFALLIGVLVLKERLDLAKVLSTVTTLLGAVLLRFAKG